MSLPQSTMITMSEQNSWLTTQPLCEQKQKLKEGGCVSLISWGLHKTLGGEGKGKSVETRFEKMRKEDAFSL